MTLKKNIAKPQGYTFVGHFHSATAHSIGLKGGDIYISRNYLTHIKNDHGTELQQLGISPIAYVKSIFRNYNRIYRGETRKQIEQGTDRKSYLFVVFNPELSHVSAIQINQSTRDGFWEVHTALPMSLSSLNKHELLHKKKDAKASFPIP